jgi:hypothetical protein
MLEQLYLHYIDLINLDINNYIKDAKSITIDQFNIILNHYNKKFFDFSLKPEIKYGIIEKAFTNNIVDIKVVPDEVGQFIPGKMVIL